MYDVYRRLEIEVGQCYLHEEHNEYVIITWTDRGRLRYAGPGFSGQMEADDFIEVFPPVNPYDIDDEELAVLLQACPDETAASTGFLDNGE